MKWSHATIWGGVAVSAIATCVTVFCCLHIWFLTSLRGSPSFTVDEVLACLALAVTLVGVVVAVAAIGIGMAALFGYAELRAVTLRKTEEQLHKIIANLQASGDLAAGTAKLLQSSIAVERPPPAAKKPNVRTASNGSKPKSAAQTPKRIAKQYPQADKEAK